MNDPEEEIEDFLSPLDSGAAPYLRALLRGGSSTRSWELELEVGGSDDDSLEEVEEMFERRLLHLIQTMEEKDGGGR